MILRAREPHCFLCFGMPLEFGPIGGSQVGLGRVRANSRTACHAPGSDELGNGHLIVMLRHSNPPAKSRPAMTAGGSLINSQRAGQEGWLCLGRFRSRQHPSGGAHATVQHFASTSALLSARWTPGVLAPYRAPPSQLANESARCRLSSTLQGPPPATN